MKLIELENSKKARISFEEISELVLPDYKVSEKFLTAGINALNGERSFVLELVLPANNSYYVALGGKYVPMTGCKNLHLEVRFAEGNVENYSNTSAYNKKTVFKGLPKEYVETVLITATDYLQVNEISGGKIVFDSAAYCEVGSSPLMFGVATKIVLNILLNKHYPISDSDIKNICEKHLLERING